MPRCRPRPRPRRGGRPRQTVAAVLAALLGVLVVAVPAVSQAPPPGSPGAAGQAVLSVDPSRAHEGEPVTVVATGCVQQVRFVVSGPAGTLVDQIAVGDPYRVSFQAPAGSAGSSLVVDASCQAADGTVAFAYERTSVAVVAPGSDATISARPSAVDAGGTTTVSGTGCGSAAAPGAVDLAAFGQIQTLSTAADGTWTVALSVPAATPTGQQTVSSRCQAGAGSFEYADLQLAVTGSPRPIGAAGGGSTGGGSTVTAPPANTPTTPADGVAVAPAAVPAAGGAPAPASPGSPTVPPVTAAATPVPGVADYVG